MNKTIINTLEELEQAIRSNTDKYTYCFNLDNRYYVDYRNLEQDYIISMQLVNKLPSFYRDYKLFINV